MGRVEQAPGSEMVGEPAFLAPSFGVPWGRHGIQRTALLQTMGNARECGGVGEGRGDKSRAPVLPLLLAFRTSSDISTHLSEPQFSSQYISAAETSPGNTLAMHILRLYPRPTESETLGV